MRFPLYLKLMLILGLGVLTNCTNKIQEKSQLIGRWEVVQAFRNGKETESLHGAYFEFPESGNMKTNLTGSEVSSEYALQKSSIIQKSPMEITYEIAENDGKKMVLLTSIREYDFRLVLEKSVGQPAN